MLEKIYQAPNKVQEEELEFFKQPEVKELLNKADIDIKLIEKYFVFRDEVEAEIKKYFRKVESVVENQKKTGFKAYGLGR